MYAQKKILKKCIHCGKYKASKQGARGGKPRFKCLNCGLWFIKNDKNKKCSINEIQILLDHLDGFSFRVLAGRCSIGRTRLCKIVNNQIANFKNNFEITKYFFDQLLYSGNLVLDGKYIPVKEEEKTSRPITGKVPRSWKHRKVRKGKVLIWGVDYGKHDIPHHEFDISENGYVFDLYFKRLKSLGYLMKSLTIDDKREIIQAVKRYYPNCVIQLCVKHYIAKINRIMCVDHIKIRIGSLEKKLETLFANKDSDYIPSTRPRSIERAAQWSNEIAELEFKYELLLDFQKIIKSIVYADSVDVKNYDIALYRIESLEKYFWPRRFAMREFFPQEHIEIIKKLFTDFKEHKKYLINYLKYPRLNIPHTTNLIEGYNSQLEKRLNSIRCFEAIKTAENYVNAWIIKRRFSKFTDCREPFKHFNGKTPLECAGVDISNIHNWIEFVQNLRL